MRHVGRKCLALLLTAALFLSLVGTAAAESRSNSPAYAPTFWDTYQTKYQMAVETLYALKVVNGRSENMFEPAAGVTRAEMAAMVVRALGLQPQAPSAAPFADVPIRHWASGPIGAAAGMGIVKGGDDGLFHPNDPVTYPQVVAMLVRALQLEPAAGVYPTGYVLLAQKLGLINDVDWGMDNAATRGDVALMLYQAIFNVKQGGMGRTLSQTVFKQAASIKIGPASDVLPVGTTTLTAVIGDWVGNPLDGTPTWQVVSGNATIDSAGNLKVSSGPVKVQADFGSLTDTRVYNVVQSLKVTAASNSVNTGAQVQVKAVGIDTNGKEVAVKPTWSVVAGTGDITDNGLLTVTGTSSVTVRATAGPLTADTTVYVVSGLTISPATVTTTLNQDVQFTATVTDAANHTVTAPVTWSVTGAGSVDQTGKFHPGDGAATVTAQLGAKQATATVRVIDRIAISPLSATVGQGGTQAFTGTAYTSANEVVSVPITWSVDTSTIGFINANGVFFGSASGNGNVVASYNGLTSKAPISVGGLATGIALSASPTTLLANGSATSVITARLIDVNGNTASGSGTVFFSISSANLGSLSNQNVAAVGGIATTTLTAGTSSGTYTIMASVPGSNIPGTSLMITTNTPSIDHIVLDAYPSPLAADGVSQTTITARLVDTTGATIINNTGLPLTVQLNTSGSGAGHLLNSTAILIPVGQSSGTANFVASAAPGSTTVTGTSSFAVTPVTVTSQVVGAATQVKIRSNIPDTKADGVSQALVYVDVEDAAGHARTGDNGTIISLTAVSGANTISIPAQVTRWGVAKFPLTALKAGTYTLNASAAGTSLAPDSSQVVFTAGRAAKVTLTVDPSASIAADGSTSATLHARILDQYDNLVTTATNTVRFVRDSLTDPVTFLPANTSVQAVGGEALLKITSTTSVGNDRYHAEADNLSSSSSTTVVTRITGMAAKAQVQKPSPETIAPNATATVQVWVLDSAGQLVTGDNGRLITLVGNNGAVVSAPATTVNGIATFTVSGTTAGGSSLTAVAPGLLADSVGQTLTIAQGSPDHIILTAEPEGLAADSASHGVIKARLVDQWGNTVVGNYPVSLTLSTGNYLNLTSTLVPANGQVDVWSRGTAGTTTITGTAGGYAVTPLTLSTYVAGTPTRVAIDAIAGPVQAGLGTPSQVKLKVRILDQSGNTLTSLYTGNDLTSMAVQISGNSSSTSTAITNANNTGLSLHNILPNGITIGSAMVTGGVANLTVTNTKAETITLTPVVYYRGVQLPATPVTMTTTAGPAAILSVTGPTGISTAGGTNVVVSASVADVYGNPVGGTSDTITFAVNTTACLALPAQTVIDAPTGTAAISLTSRVCNGGYTTVTATSRRMGFSGSANILVDQAPQKPTMWASDNSGIDSVIAPSELGARVTIVLPVRLAPQTVTVYVNGVVVPLYDTVTGSTLVDTVPAGSNYLRGYIKRADLGVTGSKEIRVIISSPLGMSPLSDPAYLTLQ